MSELVNFAKREMKIAEMSDTIYEELLPNSVLEMVKVFSNQDHSGMSANVTINLLNKLLRFEPLTPLRGTKDEWMEIGKKGRKKLWQNKRCSHVFKEGKEAYDIDGKIFREPNGACYTGVESRVPVTFPYTPTREYVDVPDHKDE